MVSVLAEHQNIFIGIKTIIKLIQYPILCEILQSNIFNAFDAAITKHRNNTIGYLEKCLSDVRKHVLLVNAVDRI